MKDTVLHKPISIFIACTFLLTALSVQATKPVIAQSPAVEFTVDSFEDLADIHPNQVCSAGQEEGGPCTLRAAITEAENVVKAGKDLIIYLPSGTYPLSLTSSDPSVADEHVGDLDLRGPDHNVEVPQKVSILGTGATQPVIDAQKNDRVLEVYGSVNVLLQNLVIKNGNLESDDSYVYGGGIKFTGKNLELKNVALLDNQVRGIVPGPSFGKGGALSLENANLLMEGCEISGNKADSSAAISAWDGSENRDKYHLLIRNSVIHGNQNFDSERAVIQTYARLFLVNSTIANNISAIGNNLESLVDVYIQNSTLQAPESSRNLYIWHNNVYLRNSIFISSDKVNCEEQDNLNRFVSQGGNLFDDESCSPNASLNDLVISPDAWRLEAFNGQYFLPSPESPVVNHISGSCRVFSHFNGDLIVDQDLLSDQRGQPRDDGYCDAGSIEILKPTPPKRDTFLPLIRR